MRFQMLTGDTLAFSYSSWVIVLRNSLAHERQINLSVVAVGRSVVEYLTLEDLAMKANSPARHNVSV